MNTQEQRQPPILIVAFFTEMWERFGFYIVQGLLVLYMTKLFHFSDDKSYNILGAFTALAYITPIAGGMIANRILGFRHAIHLGILMLSAGYFILALPYPTTFYLGLGFLCLGNGFFKPNVSVYLGTFYKENDPRRDQGFSIFYAGINLGSLLSFGLAGFIIEFLGWNATFVFSGAGLIIGFLIFWLGNRLLKKFGRLKQIETQANTTKPTLSKILLIYIGIVIGILCIDSIIHFEMFANIILGLGTAALVVFLACQIHRSGKLYRHHLIVCAILIIFAILYWALYFQMFFSATLFISRTVSHHVFGVHIPTPTFFAIDSLGVIVFGFLFGFLWRTLERRNKDWSHPSKLIGAFICMALVFIFLIISAHTPSTHGLSNPYWVVLGIATFALSEIFLGPIGLAAITRLAPPHLVGMMMGGWLIAIGLGGKLASLLAHMAAITPNKNQNLKSIEHVYIHSFEIFIAIALIIAVILFFMKPWIKRLVEEGHEAKQA